MTKAKKSAADYRIPFFIMTIIFTLAMPALATKVFGNEAELIQHKEECIQNRFEVYKESNERFGTILNSITEIEKSIIRIEQKIPKG